MTSNLDKRFRDKSLTWLLALSPPWRIECIGGVKAEL
jgi:hypothetical protein